jgi:anti-anti-sigma factor
MTNRDSRLPPGGTADAIRQTLTLHGRVDVLSAGAMRARLHSAIDAGRGELAVDVARLEFGDHAGLGVLLGGARRARSRGRSMVLVDTPPSIAGPLRTSSLTGLLRIEAAAH